MTRIFASQNFLALRLASPRSRLLAPIACTAILRLI